MNTGLGISFFRIVNEEGPNGWAQVYARIPFDDSELLSKGALFGVIFGKEKEGWAEKDAELMGWVEEYFNKIETEGELSDFFQNWRERYADLSGVWVWVLERDGERKVMMVRWGTAGLSLLKEGKEFEVTEVLAEGKVAKGKMEEGDRIVIWTEGLPSKVQDMKMMKLKEPEVSELNKKIKDEEHAGAGIILDFQKYEGRLRIDPTPVFVVDRAVSPADEEESRVIVIQHDEEVVKNRFVGPLGVKEKIGNWWLKMADKWKRPVRQQGVEDSEIAPKRKKLAVGLGVLFLVVLLISLVTGSIKIKREAETKRWKEFSEPIEKSLTEAVGLVQLNPSGARKLVQDTKTSFEEKSAIFLEGGRSQEVSVLQKKIDDTWVMVSGEKESEIEELARIDLVRQGYKGDRLGLIKDKQMVALDSSMGVVVSMELSTKDIKVVAGKGEGLGWLDVVIDNTKTIVLNSSGAREASNGQDLIKFDAAVVKPVALGKFGGNIYVLDQGNKEIYRYAQVGDGYGERVRWLKQEQTIGIDPVDMAIDSDIWVVSESGQVEKFRRGSRESFGISGLTNGMKISRIAVELEGDRLALLDRSSGAVALCSKSTGSCSQLLKSEKLKETRDIEFDGEGRLLVLTAGVVGVLK